MTEDTRKLFDKFTVDGRPIYLKDLDLSKLDSRELYDLFNILNVILARMNLMKNNMEMCSIYLNKDKEPEPVMDSVIGRIPFKLEEDGSLNPYLTRSLMASHYCAQNVLYELIDGLRNFLLGELFHVAITRYRTEQDGRIPIDMKFHYRDDDYVVYTCIEPPKEGEE